MSRRHKVEPETAIRVQYHPGLGGGGADDILRPTLMSVSNGGCYRLVVDTFGKRTVDEEDEEQIVATAVEDNKPHYGRGREKKVPIQG